VAPAFEPVDEALGSLRAGPLPLRLLRFDFKRV